MRTIILVDRHNVRLWHGRLRDRLSRLLPDAKIWLSGEDGAGAFPQNIDLLLTLEHVLIPRARPALADLAPSDADFLAQDDATAPDVIIDLTGQDEIGSQARSAQVLRPLYDGSRSEVMAIAALLDGACPSIALEDAQNGEIVAEGLPSLEAAAGLNGSLDALYSRVITLIEQALLSPRRVHARAPAMTRSAPAATAFLLRNLARACARQIYHLCCHSPHWRVGWRFIDGPGVLETSSLAGGSWNVLPDFGSGFCADPFPIQWAGENYIFFERFDYCAGKGTIFAQAFDASGPAGAPFLVLEKPWHLSYPFLIEYEGQLYMLPEASESGAVSIYRCVDFPHKWECAGQLLTGVEAADATIFRHDRRFWMMSAVRDGIGGYSDTLAIHHASDLFGRWEEHAQRPALVDSRLARPAGAVESVNGALWRPVQDCSTGYGKKLALVRIDRLDPEKFVQTRMHLISPGRFWPGGRLHTLNRRGRLECIDGAIFTPKNQILRRWTHNFIDRRPAL